MYKDFTDQARNIMASAEHQARQMNHEYVGTGHILLALVDENSGIAADVLHSLGVESSNVRREIENLVERGSDAITLKVLPLTPRAKQAIEFAGEEARYWLKAGWGGTFAVGADAQAGRRGGTGTAESRAETEQGQAQGIQDSHSANENRGAGRAARAGRHTAQAENPRGIVRASHRDLRRRTGQAPQSGRGVGRGGPTLRRSGRVVRELEAALPYHEGISHFVKPGSHGGRSETAARFSLRLARQSFYVLAVVPGLVSPVNFSASAGSKKSGYSGVFSPLSCWLLRSHSSW